MNSQLSKNPRAVYLGNKYKLNPEYEVIETSTGKNLGELTISDSEEARLMMADHYTNLLEQAKLKNQGLLRSDS
jgi:hypothetical protein